MAPTLRLSILLCLIGSGVSTLLGLSPGSTRGEVVAHYGSPAGVVVVGDREVLTYPTRKVTLVNGRMVSDSEKSDAESFVTTVAAKPVEWLSDLGAATEKAEREKKQILVLFEGPTKPEWASAFERAFVNNPAFLRRLQHEHVFLKLAVDGPLPTNAGINAVNDQKRVEELRSRAVGASPLPALAILSADTRKAKTVPLAGIEKATDRMEFFTSRAIEKAKAGPITVAKIPVKILIIGLGVVVATVMLFRKGKSPASTKARASTKPNREEPAK